MPPPAAAAPAASPFEGVWLGKVSGPDVSTEIDFAFTRGPKGLRTTFTLPEMAVFGMNLGPSAIADDTYTFDYLKIRLTRTGDTLTGTFANPLLKVELHREVELPTAPAAPTYPAAPAPRWSVKLGAQLWASPVVREGEIYVGTVDGKFHALKATDGSEAWTWSGTHALYGAATITDSSVLFIDEACELICLNRTDGQLRWRTPLAASLAEPPKNETFNRRTVTPVVREGVVYVGSADHGLYALAADTGKQLWRFDAGAPIYAAVAIEGDALLVSCYDGSVRLVDCRTQKELAHTKLPGSVASTAVVAGDILLVGCRDYLLYGLKRSDLSIAWRKPYWFSWVESVPALVDGVAYIGGSDFRYISALDPSTGHARWATDVRGLTWGTPLVTVDRVFAGSSAQNPAAIKHEGGIMALDRRTGAVLWRYPIALPAGADRAGVLGSLALAGDTVIAAAYDGTVLAFPTEP